MEPVASPSTTSWTKRSMSAPQVRAADLVPAHELVPGAGQDAAPRLQDGRRIDEGEGEVGVLLDHEHRDRRLLPQPPDGLVDGRGGRRGEPERRFVEQ